MKLRNSILIALIISVCIFASHQAHAASAPESSVHPSFTKHWSFGLTSGVGIGAQFINEGNDTCVSDEGALCDLGNALVSIFEGLYGVIPIMALADYRFAPHGSLRFGAGVDLYDLGDVNADPDGGVYYDSMPAAFPAGEAVVLWHILKDDKLFHPYLGAGLRFPIANPEILVGNQFHVSRHVGIFLEAAGSMLPFVDQKFEGRLGVMIR